MLRAVVSRIRSTTMTLLRAIVAHLVLLACNDRGDATNAAPLPDVAPSASAPAPAPATASEGALAVTTAKAPRPPPSASTAPSAPPPRPPVYLKDNPKCAVPEGFDAWSWKRVHRVDIDERAVIFTLDVGARVPNMEQVLDILRNEGVKTTIFLYTAELEKNPRGHEIVRRMIADGHELANHTRTHRDLTKLDEEAAGEELDAVERFVKASDPTATTMPFFREPYLATNDAVDALIKERCYRPIWFTVDTADWTEDATAEKIERSVFEKRGKPRAIESGSILIFHGSQKENLVALPRIIARLRDQGFSFLRLGDALRRAKAP